MTGPISVIIPTLNAAASLADCLRALDAPLVHEVIVADAGSSDDTRKVAEQAGVRVLGPLPPSRGGQLRAGCAVARGEWLLALHADTRLGPDWAEAAGRHLAKWSDRAGWFTFALDDPRPVARLWEVGVGLRSCLGWPYGDQGLLISRPLYEEVGGYRDLPLMEDLDIVRRLGAKRLRGVGARALTSAARYQRGGYLKRGLRNWALVSRWLAGADPKDLARSYRR